MSDFYGECYGATASPSACASWSASNPACATCLRTPQDDAGTFGAVIALADGVDDVNVGGCIALVSGDTSATGCGARFWEANLCEDLACKAACAPTSGFDRYLSCTQTAANGVCAPYVNAMCISPDAGAVYDTCLNHATFQDLTMSVGARFCSTSVDAGDDAAADASAD